MLFKSFAHWLLLAFFVFAFLVLCLLGMWLGWWGSFLETHLQGAIKPIFDFYSANEPAINLALRVIGLSGTALTGLYGLHKAWYYAETNLPKRLDEYIESNRNKSIIGERDRLLVDFKSDQTSVLERVNAEKPKIESTLALLTQAKDSWAKQMATLHYVYGQQKVGQASQTSSSQFEKYESAHFREQAIEHFKQAAELDRSDLNGWLYAAKQAEAIHHREKAVEYWNALASAYQERGDTLQQSRAQYFAAHNFWHRSKDPSFRTLQKNEFLRRARDILGDARQLLQQRRDTDWIRLQAQCCELLGRVRIELDTLPSARSVLEEALQAFKSINDEEGFNRASELLAEVTQHQSGPVHDKTATSSNPDFLLASGYESVGTAHLGRDDIAGGPSKANKYLRLALLYYEKVEPRPIDDIARVKQYLSDDWLQ